MQPILASGGAANIVMSSKATARQQPAVNSASFWNKKAGEVSAEDTFFHEYFSRVGKTSQSTKAKKKAAEALGSDDEEAEGEIWEALVNSRPDVEGGDDNDESDVDMDSYSDSDDDLGGAFDAGEMFDAGSDGSGGFEGIFEDSESEAVDNDEEEDVKEGEKKREDAGSGSGSKTRLKRSEMRSLPTFASAEDYAEMLAGEEDGM